MADDKQAISRETLYEEVWREPVSRIAPRYGLSDVGFSKLCRNLQIPLPQRGHWAKLQAGKQVARPPLRKLRGEHPQVAYLCRISDAELARRADAKQQASALRRQVRDSTPDASPADAKPHPLVTAAGRRLRRKEGWNNEKGLRSAPEEVLHIDVTPSSLDRALALMNTLLRELERQDIRARIDRENKCTILDIKGTPVQLMLSEHVKRTDHEITDAERAARERYISKSRIGLHTPYPHIPRHDFHPTGAFTLTAGHWPSRAWRDTKRTQLEQRLGEIVAGLLQLADDIRAREQEQARQAEARRLAEEDYAIRKQRLDDERAKFQQLENQANDLERARRLRAYADTVEAAARTAGNLSDKLQEWLAWAHAKADWLDPTIAVSDVILDAPEPKKPGIWW